MRLISPLSLDSILSFTGAIITDRDIISYDANLDLEEILENTRSMKAKEISLVNNDPLVRFLSFYNDQGTYENWRIKSIILYKGDIDDPGNLIVLAILNEDVIQETESKKFNFRLYFYPDSNLINITYNGVISHIPHISENNEIIKPFSVDRELSVINKLSATELNNSQLAAPGIIGKFSESFINPITNLRLKTGFEFKILLPLIVEGIPFLTGIIENITNKDIIEFSFDLSNFKFYLSTSSNSQAKDIFYLEFLKDYKIINPITYRRLLFGATEITRKSPNYGINDLIRSTTIRLSGKLLSSFFYGFYSYIDGTDFVECNSDSWTNLLGVNIPDYFKTQLTVTKSKLRLLTKNNAIFINLNISNDEYGLIIVNRKEKSKSELCLNIEQTNSLIAPTKNGLSVCFNTNEGLRWITLLSDGTYENNQNWDSNQCIIELFGSNFLLEDRKNLVRL